MAVNQEKVNAACEALNAEGKSPTLAAVREALGEGSYSSLAKMVKVWRITQADAEPVTPGIEVPDSVQELADRMAAGIWAEAEKMANARLEADREKFDQEKREMTEEMEEAYRTAEQAMDELKALKAQFTEMATDAKSWEKYAREKVAEVERLNAVLDVTKAEATKTNELFQALIAKTGEATKAAPVAEDKRNAYAVAKTKINSEAKAKRAKAQEPRIVTGE